ncbi:hypothetical protein ACFX15_021441 [Malus domestica]
MMTLTSVVIKTQKVAVSSRKESSKSELFASGISVGDVSWPTSAQLPGRLAPVEGCCRAYASLSGFVGQASSGKTRQAQLVGQGWKRRTSLTLRDAFVGP